ncbi:MAG: IS982 family transposase [Methyloprofundus sp.]|nr:IS982 family transposase [Methyloprofundus sp.]
MKHLTGAFPKAPSYNRFIELLPDIIVPLTHFMQSRCSKGEGIAFVDSTPLCVGKTSVFLDIKRSKSKRNAASHQPGWFYGFKLHIIVDDRGEILSFAITRGNVDDRKPVPKLSKNIIGKLFGDRGYISKKLTELLAANDVELITTLKKNMQPKVIAAFDDLLLKKRSIIETINAQAEKCFSA